MKKTRLTRLLCVIVCIVLIAAMALITTSCDGNTDSSGSNTDVATEKTFSFTVVDVDGKESKFEITTDKKTVGEALLDEGLIAGEDSEYGLYVKTVNGITLDYDKDGKYWAFYVNGEYGMSGVDTTEIEDNAEYMFKAE